MNRVKFRSFYLTGKRPMRTVSSTGGNKINNSRLFVLVYTNTQAEVVIL